MAEVLPVALLVSSTFSVILLGVKDKKYSQNMCIYAGPHKHNTISMTLCENATLQLCSFSVEDAMTTLSH